MSMQKLQDFMKTVRVPSQHDRVFKGECMFSFDTPESPSGLYTSLTTWQSFGFDYVNQDYEKYKNPLYLKQISKLVLKDKKEDEEEECKAPTKMAIGVEGGFDLDNTKYDKDVTNYLVILPSHEQIKLPSDQIPTIITMTIDAILSHAGVEKSAQLTTAWEEEALIESKYAKDIPQLENGKKISPDPKQWRCEESGQSENLWLNLSTGHIGSGRKHYGGQGGTGAALVHYEETDRKYPLAVKLGTITPQGADVFSYAPDENDMVADPYLSEHLAHWGINMQKQKKTEKTMIEMQIDLNNSYEWSKITESGSQLIPLHGPGYVGLRNLGNSCYMASVLQLLFSVTELVHRYKDRASQIYLSAPSDPSEDLLSMMAKMAIGLYSGRYTNPIALYEKDPLSPSVLTLSEKTSEHYGSVRPFMFKALIGKGHSEFSSSRQQDASEFFQYFLDKITRAERADRSRLLQEGEPDAKFIQTSALFGFELEERIEDAQTKKVRYITRSENLLSLAIDTRAAINRAQYDEFEEKLKKKPKLEEEIEPVKLQVPLSACLQLHAQSEIVENFKSPETGELGNALKRTRFKTFPAYLAINLKRYYMQEDWTPKKLDVSVPMPYELDLGSLRGTGQVDGEILMADNQLDQQMDQQPEIVPDPGIVSQLVSMGFSENGSKRAAIAKRNESAETCMEWVFAHMEDPDFNDPPEVKEKANGATNCINSDFSPDSVLTLTSMGFNDKHAKAALAATNGSIERAADWLFSHSANLEAAVKEVEKDNESSVEADTDGSTNGVTLLDGQSRYELLGFASHLGSNTSCGHYVAHIKKESHFVLFNDEKVAISQNPPSDLGFLYIYRRKGIPEGNES